MFTKEGPNHLRVLFKRVLYNEEIEWIGNAKVGWMNEGTNE